MKPFNWSTRLPLAESKLIPETRVLAPASAVLQGCLMTRLRINLRWPAF